MKTMLVIFGMINAISSFFALFLLLFLIIFIRKSKNEKKTFLKPKEITLSCSGMNFKVVQVSDDGKKILLQEGVDSFEEVLFNECWYNIDIIPESFRNAGKKFKILQDEKGFLFQEISEWVNRNDDFAVTHIIKIGEPIPQKE